MSLSIANLDNFYRDPPIEGVQWVHIGDRISLRERAFGIKGMWLAQIYMPTHGAKQEYFVSVWNFAKRGAFDRAVSHRLGPFGTLEEALLAADNTARLDLSGWALHRKPELQKRGSS